MPVHVLGAAPKFPAAGRAHASGLLAIGGRLDPEWLLAAYKGGIFPWYEEPPIQWWSPDPRLVLLPGSIRASRSLRKVIRRAVYSVRVDTAFRDVVHACAATPRPGQRGTWIVPEMERAYGAFHDAGYAHSIETWHEGTMVGGLYGVALGDCFFGESMFSTMSDASKVALVALGRECEARGIELIDCQIRTAHLVSMGAEEVPRGFFLAKLRELVDRPRPPGRWDLISNWPGVVKEGSHG